MAKKIRLRYLSFLVCVFAVRAFATSADLGIAINVAPTTIQDGSDLAISVPVTNNGPDSPDNVTVRFDSNRPIIGVIANSFQCNSANAEHTSFVCTDSRLLPQTMKVQFDGDPFTPADGTQFDLSASITSSTPDPEPSNNSASASTTVRWQADIALDNILHSSPALPGGDVSFIFRWMDNGPSAATTTLTVPAVAGMTFVSVFAPRANCTTPASGAAGEVKCTTTIPANSDVNQVNLILRIDSNVPAGSTINVSGSISSPGDTTPDNNTASTSIPIVTLANLETVLNGPATIIAGLTNTYIATIVNHGQFDGKNVTLQLPAMPQSPTPEGWTCTPSSTVVNCKIATLPSGVAADFRFNITASRSAIKGTTSTLRVSLSASNDSTAFNNSSMLILTYDTLCDLALTASAPGLVPAGADIPITFSFSDNGPSEARGFVLTYDTPLGVTFQSLVVTPAGSNVPCTAPAAGSTGRVTCAFAKSPIVINVRAAQSGGVTNTATMVSALTEDPDLSNNIASATTFVTEPADVADVAVTLEASKTIALLGEQITYTATITNNGPDAASNVALDHVLPNGSTFVSALASMGTCSGTETTTCNIPSLAIGASATVLIVANAPAQVGLAQDTASVTTESFDGHSENNSASVPLNVMSSSEPTDLSIAMSASSNSVVLGLPVVFTITVHNNGAATAIDVFDQLPASIAPLSASSACSVSGRTIHCSASSLESGGTRTFAITGTVRAVGPVANSATLTPSGKTASVTINGVLGRSRGARH